MLRLHSTCAAFAGLLLSLFFLLASAQAAGGRTPIYEIPTTLDEPGSYYLTRDLSDDGPSPSLVIAADDVTIDLAGHTLQRTDDVGDVVGVEGARTNIVIRNGRILGGARGLRLFNYSGSSFRVVVEDLLVADAADVGIFIEGGFEVLVPSNVVIRNVIVADTGSDGIHLRFIEGGGLYESQVRNAGRDGVLLDSTDSLTISRSNLSRNTRHGIRTLNARFCVIRDNQASYNGEYGIMFESVAGDDDIAWKDNTMYGNGLGSWGTIDSSLYGILQLDGNYPE